MRHKKKRLMELNTWVKKKSVFIREMLTNLVKRGRVVTTPKRAKVLKAEADAFFSKLLSYSTRYDEKSAHRECIRYVKAIIFSKEDGKKVIEEWLPKYKESKQKSFVQNYKLGFRKGDWVEKILVELM